MYAPCSATLRPVAAKADQRKRIPLTLTPRQHQQVVSRLNQVWPKPRICPICGHRDWKLHSRLFLHQALHGASATKGPNPAEMNIHQESLPAVLFWCDTCGYVVTFFASKFGLTADSVGRSEAGARLPAP